MSVTAAELQPAAVLPTIHAGDDGSNMAPEKPAVGGGGSENDGLPKSKSDSLGRSSIVGGLLGKLERLTILIGSDQDPVPPKVPPSGAPLLADAVGSSAPRSSVLLSIATAATGPPVHDLPTLLLPSLDRTDEGEPDAVAGTEALPETADQLPSAAAIRDDSVAAAATAVAMAEAATSANDAVVQQQQEPPPPSGSLAFRLLQPEHVTAQVEVVAPVIGCNDSTATAAAAAAAGDDSSGGGTGDGTGEREVADDGAGAEESMHASLQLFESVLQEVAMLAVRESGGVAGAEAAQQGPLQQPFDERLADILLEEELLWITGGVAVAAAAAAAASPPRSYAIGEVVSEGECGICLADAGSVMVPIRQRPCCHLPVCQSCLGMYFATCIAEGCTVIQCPAAACGSHVPKDEVADCLSPELRARYYRIIQNANCCPYAKTCPQCCHLHAVGGSSLAAPAVKRGGLKVACSACSFLWCFPCHSPWHEGVTCSQYQGGDKALKLWAKEKHFGQLNARKCPKCKILIQRVAGCDHIHCKQCETDFCYRCGKQHVRVRFIGDHYDPLSILGCPYAFMQGRQRHLRRFVRGSIFTGQVLAVPVGVALAVGLLPVAVAAVAIAGPVFGFIRLHRYLRQRPRRRSKTPAN